MVADMNRYHDLREYLPDLALGKIFVFLYMVLNEFV
jgi:hypothetical protein